MPGYAWVLGYAETVDSAEEARDALAKLDTLGPVPPLLPTFANNELYVGRTLVLAGRAAEGIPHLEKAARHCGRLGDAFAHPQAELELGVAREATGDAERACDAYRAVVAQWGNAKPRSVTATRARARLRALDCPHGKGD